MFNSGLVPSVIDGTEFIYENEKQQLPLQFSYMKNLPEVLDQGNDPICVPCSISAWCEYKLSLLTGSKKPSGFRLFDIFDSRTTKGEGMTCKEAFKYVIEKGAKYKNGIIHMSKYFRVTNLRSLKNAIINNGPCIAVLPVFCENNEDFWINDSYDFDGYHAVAIVGYDQDGFIIRNSWGKGYGHSGYSHISNEDLNKAEEIWTLI